MKPWPLLDQSLALSPEVIRYKGFPEIGRPIAPAFSPNVQQGVGVSRRNVIISRPIDERSIAEQLFLARMELKMWASKVAMHLDRNMRDRLFRQLDILHDAEDWVEGDKPMSLASFQGLVRSLVRDQIKKSPSLALMPNGNALALWDVKEGRLTVEYQKDQRARWLVDQHSVNGYERATGTTPLIRLRDVIHPYGAGKWFDGC